MPATVEGLNWDSLRQSDLAPRRDHYWDDWKFATSVAAGTILLCIFLSFFLGPVLGVHQWLMSSDVWWTVQSAQWVSHGAVGTVYEANPWYSALPGFLVLLAPVVALGDHLGLVTGYPLSLQYPSMWLLVGPFFFLCSATCILGIDYLASVLGVLKRRRRLILVAIALLVVVPAPAFAGHPEDMLALGLVCIAMAFAIRGHWQRAALVLAVAVMIQTWAGLLIPAFVAFSPTGLRLRNLIRATLLPASCAALLLLLDFRSASTDLLRQPMVNRGQELPWWHLAGHMLVVDDRTAISVTVGASSRRLAVVAAVLLALVVYRVQRPMMFIAVASLTLLARGIFETEIWSYYLAPASVFFVLLVAIATPGQWKRWAVGTTFGFLLTDAWPAANFGISIPPMVAEAVLLLCGAGALMAALHRDQGMAAVAQSERAPSVYPVMTGVS